MIDKIVTMTKADIGGKEIEGAEIVVTDKDGNVIRFMPDYFDTNGNFTKKYPVPQTAKEYLKNIEIMV